ncbi:MAG: hypothetical protein OXC08_20630 [Thiotrichales bacterium]|nr:hypothetical protein [Thiotrichales bacterium]
MRKGSLKGWQWTAWSLRRQYVSFVQLGELRSSIHQAQMQRAGHLVTPTFSPVMIISETLTPEVEPEAKKH